MIQLHHYPSTASMVPHILLEELGQPFELVLVDYAHQAHKSPAYLRLNPNGLIPVLTDGDLVLYETAAICLYLCDTHPDAGLAPPVGSAERAHFYKWLMWLTNTLQCTLIVYLYPERWVDEGHLEGVRQVKSHAEVRINGMLDQLDQMLGGHGNAWFMGATYSMLDPYLFTLCHWTRGFAGRSARDYEHLGPYLLRMLARPALQRVLRREKTPAPYF